jgi:FG-GAP-like repeat
VLLFSAKIVPVSEWRSHTKALKRNRLSPCKAGVAGAYFGMGIAVGDYDNDGWPDMFVTAYGKCIL